MGAGAISKLVGEDDYKNMQSTIAEELKKYGKQLKALWNNLDTFKYVRNTLTNLKHFWRLWIVLNHFKIC